MRDLLPCLVLLALSVLSCDRTAAAPPPADLVLRGGRLVTLDDDRAEAEALAVRGNRIVAVGTNAEIAPLVGPQTEVVELGGRLAIPGFIEGHGHFLGLGLSRMMLDLRGAGSWSDIVRLVDAAVRRTPPGQWIVGRGWHQEKWDRPPQPNVDGYPTHDELSGISPRHPVLLTHASGHMSIANALAMQLAGIEATTPDPPGGQLVREPSGRPIGVFRETAQGLVARARERDLRNRGPDEQRRELVRAIELAGQECLSKGVTSFQDAGSSLAEIHVFRQLAEDGQLPVRLWVMIREDNERLRQSLADYRWLHVGDDFLTVRAIKRSLDGALGPHGAWLLVPYEDLPGSIGLNLIMLESLQETAELAVQHDFQLCVHAIGDRANHETLNLFEQTFRRHPSPQSRRWRIEHAQHLAAADIPRFAALGVIASMQGIHCTSDAIFVLQRLGERRAAEGAYVWRYLLDSGAVVTNGSDAPVEDVDPLASFYASVTRKLPSGETFFPEQRMTRLEALRSYTRSNAYAAFEDDLKGTLTPGKLADIVVLTQDILRVPDDELPATRVALTIVAGKIRYRLSD